jgi:transaldolase
VLDRFARAGIDIGELAEQLQREGAEAFVKSWNDLMLCIESKAHAVDAHACKSIDVKGMSHRDRRKR